MEEKIIKSLKNLLGKDNVLTEYEDRYCYSYDAMVQDGNPYLPEVVVLPETTEQVSEVLKLAHEFSIPVTARGAGTNHVGGCIPLKGGIVIHFSKMNKILEISKDNLICKVQPGVVVEHLQKEAEKLGLFYPPDQSNLKVSTIGGSIALSSGGPRCFKYGSTKDYVLGLKVVLADGTIINTGGCTAKNVTGYNLNQLFVGSEGTLGIVTEAILKLIPQPETRKVLLAFFDSIDDSVNAITSIISERITPSTLDLMDSYTMQTIEKFSPTGLPVNMEASLLIELDGFKESIDIQRNQVVKICKLNNAKEIRISNTQEESDQIWFSRRAAFAAVSRLKPNVVTEDAVVPRDKIPEMVKELRRIADKYSITTCIMGHAGDGNIHPNFSLDLRDKDEFNRLKMAIDELFEIAIKLGGTLSGEHGIGMSKSKYLNSALDNPSLLYMKEIKKVFDPKGILNPGKVI